MDRVDALRVIQQNIGLLGVPFGAIFAWQIKRMAQVHVVAGRVTASEVSGLAQGAFALLSVAGIAQWLLFRFSSADNLMCLLSFPPTEPAGFGIWSLQFAISVFILWWLWERNGADLVYRLLPESSRGHALSVKSAQGVRLFITTLVFLVPAWVVLFQRLQAHLGVGCTAI